MTGLNGSLTGDHVGAEYQRSAVDVVDDRDTTASTTKLFYAIDRLGI